MATLQKIATDVDSAKVYAIQTMAKELVLLKAGSKSPQMKNLTALKRLIRMLNFQINAGVNDADTTLLYNCLLKSLAGFTASYTIDPSVKVPGQTIIINNTGSIVNSNIVQFSNQTVITLAAYPSAFYPLYGNHPYIQIFVDDGAGGFTPDSITAPDYVYLTPGDPTTAIQSITWTYGQNTTGYILISGTQP